MTRKALMVKVLKKTKYATRAKNRCALCGRGKGFMRKFGVCRICFRELASRGLIPGVRKASW